MSNMKKICPKCGRVFSKEDGFCDDCGCRLILASNDMKISSQSQKDSEKTQINGEASFQSNQNFYEQMPVQSQSFHKQIQSTQKKNPLLPIIIVLCVLIIAAGILIGVLIFRDSEGNIGKSNVEDVLQTTAVFAEDASSAVKDEAETVVTTLAAGENGLHFAENTMTTTVTTTTEAPEKRYQVFSEACSWEDAKQKCEAAGGHLAYITNDEDWTKVINALNETGLKYVWLGGTTSISADESRITATWLDGSSMDYIYDANHWFANEPSGRDFSSADKPLEPYILLWNVSDVWSLNDSSDAVLSCYKPERIGYVCEFD